MTPPSSFLFPQTLLIATTFGAARICPMPGQ